MVRWFWSSRNLATTSRILVRTAASAKMGSPGLLAGFLPCLWLMLVSVRWVGSYDGYSACPKPFRASRQHIQLPCDFRTQSWCTIPGSAYPWHAVRRFVHENHGLMRRMYGDERHISVLRAEIESNDLDRPWFDEEDVKHRYTGKPHFRPASPLPPPPPPPPPPPVPPSTVSPSSTTIPTTTTKPTTTSEAPISNNLTTATQPTATSSAEIHSNSSWIFGSTSTVATTTDWPTTEEDETTLDPTTTTTVKASTTTASTTTTTAPTTSTTTQTPATPSSSNSPDALRTLPTAPAPRTTSHRPPSTSATEGSTSAPTASAATLFQDALPDLNKTHHSTSTPHRQPTPLTKVRGVNACPVKEEVVAPFWANNTRGEVLALLNLYPYEQYVHWEKCTHEHKQMLCRDGCRCEQQYRLHRLLAYDPNNECRGIFSDWFKFPSCCICRCYGLTLPAEFRMTSRSPRSILPPVPEYPTNEGDYH